MQRLGKLLRIPMAIAILIAVVRGVYVLHTLDTPIAETALTVAYTAGAIALLFGVLVGGGKLLRLLVDRDRSE